MPPAPGQSCAAPVAGVIDVNDKLPTVRQLPSRDVALMDLHGFQCRFPVREDRSIPGGHRFCANATEPGQVYCAHHHAIATNVELKRSGNRFVPGLRRAA
jgi:hypothetical protein